MSKPNTYHLTVGIPYVNGRPHMGHVLEWFMGDALARYQHSLGKTVSFTAGADENSLKNVQAAQKEGVSVQDWLDEYSGIFEDAFKFFDISLTGYRRGSDTKLHWPGVQKLWELCAESDDIYTKSYKGLYCVGCESYYNPEDLVDGKCPEHLRELEEIEEENYFFKLSKYQAQIRELIVTDQLRIVSEQFKNEMLGFIDQGLEDFSISRSTTRAREVGVPVPGDDSQVMYVWFDALAIYMTAIGWGYDQDMFETFWPADVHVIGKGINRFHSIYWIGMLLSAGLDLPKAISVHGYITVEGQKMSKSLGNVIDPFELVDQYGLEPVRFYLLKEIPAHSDGDFSHERFKEVYTADLANGLGNLCSRVATLASKSDTTFANTIPTDFNSDFHAHMGNFNHDLALKWVIEQIAKADGYLSEQKPWKLSGNEQVAVLSEAINQILVVAYHLQPFMPKTAKLIIEHFQQPKIEKLTPLFPRLEK